MALTISQLATATTNSGSPVGTQAAGPFTPTADATLYVFAILNQGGHTTSSATTSISDNGGRTWTQLGITAQVNWDGDANTASRGVLWSAPVGASPASTTVTVDPNPSSGSNWYQTIVVIQVIGTHTLAQTAGVNAEDEALSDTASLTLTLGSAATTGNLVIAFFGRGNDTAATAAVPAGWTELTNLSTIWTTAAVFYRSDFTSTAVTCTDLGTDVGNSAGVIIELAEPGGGVPDNHYTELEWSIGVQAPAIEDDVYEFRVFYDDDDTALDEYLVTPQLTVEAGAGGPIEVAIPTATLLLTPQLLAAAGAGAATATVPTALLRLAGVQTAAGGAGDATPAVVPSATLRTVGQVVAGGGAGATSVAVPPATLHTTGQAVTAAGAGTGGGTIPPATLRLGGVTAAAAGAGTGGGTIPPASLILDGKTVQVSGADISVEIPTALLYFTAPTPAPTGAGAATATVPTAALRLGPQPVTPVPASANVVVPTAQLHFTAPTVAAGTAAGTAAIPPAILNLGARPVTAAGVGSVSRAVPPATIVFVAVVPLSGMPVEPVGMLTCDVDGPTVRRLVTGPGVVTFLVRGPGTQTVDVDGAGTSVDTTGPAVTSKVVAGPARQPVGALGPEVSRDVTGPLIEEFAVTGPGVCDGD